MFGHCGHKKNKRTPAPIDEKTIVSDWIYEELGDTGRAVCAYVGRCRKAAFYNNGHLWEARWLDGYNSVRIDSKTKSVDAHDAEKMAAKIRTLFMECEDFVTEVRASKNSDESFTINISFFYEEE